MSDKNDVVSPGIVESMHSMQLLARGLGAVGGEKLPPLPDVKDPAPPLLPKPPAVNKPVVLPKPQVRIQKKTPHQSLFTTETAHLILLCISGLCICVCSWAGPVRCVHT